VNLDGKPLERAPDFTLNAGAQYRMDVRLPLFSALTVQGSVLYSTTSVLRYYNDAPGESQPPYAVGNLSATLADAGEKTRLVFFVNNVGDTLYKQQVTNFGLGNLGNYGPPRTFGVSLSRKF
jgi:outer membrane receptor for ferrienterochelin and colicin